MDKPIRIKKKVDHSKLRASALNIWHPDATQLDIGSLNLNDIKHNEWVMIYEQEA
jgi:hypothetical protein